MMKQFNSAQEACDYSVQKLVEQGGRCYDAVNTTCMHGDGQGNHCAIGWLLDPNNKELMGYDLGVQDVVEYFPDDVPQIIKDNVKLFGTLQEFHDEEHSIVREACRDRLRDNYKIDTSAAHWQQWIDMGEQE